MSKARSAPTTAITFRRVAGGRLHRVLRNQLSSALTIRRPATVEVGSLATYAQNMANDVAMKKLAR